MSERYEHADEDQRALLLRVAREAMVEHGLEPDFPARGAGRGGRAARALRRTATGRDLRELPWCSIDNDDSRDLDQLTVAEALPAAARGSWWRWPTSAPLVAPGSAVDAHAGANTTSVYTPPQIFPMLPERLSTDLTSLNPGEDRLAVVVEMTVDDGGAVGDRATSTARSCATTPSSPTRAWAPGSRARRQMPAALAAVPGLAENLRLQDQAAQRLQAHRHEHGALELETIEVRARLRRRHGERPRGRRAQPRQGDHRGLHDRRQRRDRPLPRRSAASRSCAAWCARPSAGSASSTSPLDHGDELPAEPDAKALHDFLVGAARRIRCASPTSRSRSSSCSARASTWPSLPGRGGRPATSAWR